MGRRVLAGSLVVAIALSLLGAATYADEIAEQGLTSPAYSTSIDDLQGGVEPDERPKLGASTQIPIRSAALTQQAANVVDSPPVRLRAASIGLDASVVPVGVDQDQRFDVPSAEEVGWYKFGSGPGEPGSTVLAAHVDFAGRPGAFFALAGISAGDELEVEMADQTIRSYRVINNVLHDKTELPAEELFRRTGSPILQLITCGGTFDFETRSYRGNVVVTAVPIEA